MAAPILKMKFTNLGDIKGLSSRSLISFNEEFLAIVMIVSILILS
jgi:hypothetical protein